jgi:hypothetical protein
MVCKLAGKKSIFVGTLVLILIVSTAWLLVQNDFVRFILDRPREDYVIGTIEVGDSEAKLLTSLEDHGVEYSRTLEGGMTFYSISDGFVGVCFYYVADGKVVDIVFD